MASELNLISRCLFGSKVFDTLSIGRTEQRGGNDGYVYKNHTQHDRHENTQDNREIQCVNSHKQDRIDAQNDRDGSKEAPEISAQDGPPFSDAECGCERI